MRAIVLGGQPRLRRCGREEDRLWRKKPHIVSYLISNGSALPENKLVTIGKSLHRGCAVHRRFGGNAYSNLNITPRYIMFATIGLLLYLGIVVLVIAGVWKVFTKAGQPGWAAIIPIYNIYILTKIAGKPGWWLLLFFIPVVNFVIAILVAIDVAKAFGKGTGFALGLVFLGIIFYPILGFGDAQYQAVPVQS